MLTRRVEKEIEDKIKGSFLTWDSKPRARELVGGGKCQKQKRVEKGPHITSLLDDNSLINKQKYNPTKETFEPETTKTCGVWEWV